ncbi:MAG: WD40 repeat domain-containing protein, partial [Promethearchaeota archaeon]
MQIELQKKDGKSSFEFPQHLYPKRKGLARAFHMPQSFGHSRSINSVAVTNKGDNIISGSDDKTLKIWNFSTGNLIRTIEAHNQPILSVAISLDDTYIFSGSSDNLIKVWGKVRGNLITEFDEHTDAVTSLVVPPGGKNLISGSKDGQAIIWDVLGGKVLHRFEHKSGVSSMALFNDGKYLACGTDNGVINLWNLEKQK